MTARVNSAQPDEAVLIASSSFSDYSGVAFGLTFAGFAIMFVVIAVLSSSAPAANDLVERAEQHDANHR